ncbi:7222_t:CDS:1, partial [Ambispora leptoticha]
TKDGSESGYFRYLPKSKVYRKYFRTGSGLPKCSKLESPTETRKSYRNSKVLPKLESLTETRKSYRNSKVLLKLEPFTESRNSYQSQNSFFEHIM